MVRWKSSSNLDTRLKMVCDHWLQLNRKSNSVVGWGGCLCIVS